jgi:DNA-binding MarR family transcriptional regulator
MSAKSGIKAGKAATQVTMSNGAATPTLSARVKPLPAKVLKNLAALAEPHRLVVLGYVAAAAGPVTLSDVADRLRTTTETATSAVNWLKQRGWLASERVPKGGGGGWQYRLSDAGRERLMALGG